MNWFSVFFGFSGRINRAKYWIAVVVYMAIWTVFGLAMINSLGKVQPDDPLGAASLGFAVFGLMMLIGIVTTISGLAVSVKRLHDRDKSGWWILLFWFLPGIIGAMQATTTNAALMFAYGAASLAVALWGLIELGFLRGTPGPNRFGPDPLGALLAEPLR